MTWGPLRLTAMERDKLIDAAEKWLTARLVGSTSGAEIRTAIDEGFINAVEDILNEKHEYLTEPVANFKTPE